MIKKMIATSNTERIRVIFLILFPKDKNTINTNYCMYNLSPAYNI